MSDILHTRSDKYWVRCGHLTRGVCRTCLRRDLLWPFEQAVGVLRDVREHLHDEDTDAVAIDRLLAHQVPGPLRTPEEAE